MLWKSQQFRDKLATWCIAHCAVCSVKLGFFSGVPVQTLVSIVHNRKLHSKFRGSMKKKFTYKETKLLVRKKITCNEKNLFVKKFFVKKTIDQYMKSYEKKIKQSGVSFVETKFLVRFKISG